MPINKKELNDAILAKLTSELTGLLKAAESAYDGAVHEEAVAKSKYETHGLELSYLAGSQFERAIKLRRQIAAFKTQAVREFSENDAIAVGALITLAEGEALEFIYLCNLGAGMILTLNGKSIQVATPLSPLGKLLLDSFVGDTIEWPTAQGIKSKEIVNIS